MPCFLISEGNENASPQTYRNMNSYQYTLLPLFMNMFSLQSRFWVSQGIDSCLLPVWQCHLGISLREATSPMAMTQTEGAVVGLGQH